MPKVMIEIRITNAMPRGLPIGPCAPVAGAGTGGGLDATSGSGGVPPDADVVGSSVSLTPIPFRRWRRGADALREWPGRLSLRGVYEAWAAVTSSGPMILRTGPSLMRCSDARH